MRTQLITVIYKKKTKNLKPLLEEADFQRRQKSRCLYV